MFTQKILEGFRLEKIADLTTTGTSAINGATVDLAAGGQFDQAIIATEVATAAASHNVKLQNSDDGSTWADVAGSARVVTVNKQVITHEIVNASKRYWRQVFTRATTGTVLGEQWCIKGPAKSQPVAQPALTIVVPGDPGALNGTA